MKTLLLFFAGIMFSIYTTAQVGINTTNPEEELHISGVNTNILIEGLSITNNINNLGVGKTTKVYVDTNGDLVLGTATQKLEMLVDSENYLNDVENPTNLINQTGNAFGYDLAGVPSDLTAAQFTLTGDAIVEINYSLSWSVYDATSNPTKRLDDTRARVIQTGVYFRLVTDPSDPLSGVAVVNDLDGNPINGGPWCIDVNASGTVCQETGGLLAINGQFYNNADNTNGAYQNFQNTGSDYVKLGPGTYIALFAGQMAVGTTNGAGAAKLFLGSGEDDLQIIAHYY
ncbi:hypothetical protein [Dokdonia sp.]|uniref:hypothetical protein n=1 Tax=Dokdonia sp. TaxID=2024995 RepID=UPI003266BCFB